MKRTESLDYLISNNVYYVHLGKNKKNKREFRGSFVN